MSGNPVNADVVVVLGESVDGVLKTSGDMSGNPSGVPEVAVVYTGLQGTTVVTTALSLDKALDAAETATLVPGVTVDEGKVGSCSQCYCC